jgi:hypothetical protein
VKTVSDGDDYAAMYGCSDGASGAVEPRIGPATAQAVKAVAAEVVALAAEAVA